jgi:hypothetical protein
VGLVVNDQCVHGKHLLPACTTLRSHRAVRECSVFGGTWR